MTDSDTTAVADPTVDPITAEEDNSPVLAEDVVFISIDEIQTDKVKLRDVYKKGPEAEEYLEMKDSIEAIGLLNPVSVRLNPEAGQPVEEADPAKGTQKKYILVTGGHRTEAHRDLVAEGKEAFSRIKATIRDITAKEALSEQIEENAQRIITRPADYADALFHLISETPGINQKNLAKKVHKTEAWVSANLRISELEQPVKDKINDGKITAAAGTVLGRLYSKKYRAFISEEEFADWVEQAEKMNSNDFLDKAQDRLEAVRAEESEFKKTRRESPPVKTPLEPKCRSTREILDLWKQVNAKDYDGPLDKTTMAFLVRMDKASKAEHNKNYKLRLKNFEASKGLKALKKKAEEAEIKFEKGCFKGKTVSQQLEVVAAAFEAAGDTKTAKAARKL